MEHAAADNDFLPAWINKSLIAKAWKSGCPEVNADSVQIRSASKVGGGMLSETFRVVAVDGGGAEKSFVIKSAPDVEGPLKEFIESGVFYKEKTAYATALTAIDDSLRSIDGDAWRPMAPKLYFKGKHPVEFLVLEDLVASGFSSFEGRKPLDLAHSTAAVKKIAKFHAASLLQVDDTLYEKDTFRQSLLFNTRVRDTMIEHVSKTSTFIADVLDDLPWFGPYKGKFDDFGPKLLNKAVDVVCEDSAPVKVLLHGDCHCGNMMFRGSEEELEVRIYDFQGLHVGSPAEDLQYFFHMSLSLEILRDHVDLLVRQYHDTFICTLRALGMEDIADRYPLQQLAKEMDRLQSIAAYCSYFLMPFVLRLASNNFDLNSTAPGNEEKAEQFVMDSYRNKEAHKYFELLTPSFYQKGLFDL